MKRRPKGMGSYTKLSGRRRKPYKATLSGVCIGTYKTSQDCEKALLYNVIKNENLMPDFIKGLDTMENKYINFIIDLQGKGILSNSVLEFPDMSIFIDSFKNHLIAEGYSIQQQDNHAMMYDNIPTFSEIWDLEYNRLIILRSKAWKYSMASSFKHLEPLHNMKINMIKTEALQNCFDEQMKIGCGESKLTNMMNVCKIVFAYALKMDLVTKDYTSFIEYHPTNEKKAKRKIFTNDEIKALIKDNSDNSKIILIYIFTGMRPSELLSIPIKDIHIEEKYMIGGMKTKAGKNRIIPLHEDILPYIEYFLDKNNDYPYLFYPTDARSSYQAYRTAYHSTMTRLNLEHVEPYDTRHTFSTISKLNGVDPSVRKKILGHTCKDITDDVYTHEPLSFLLEEINKIKIK